MYNLTDREIVLGVSGSIAAYKAADLASKLTQAGVRLDVVLTPAAAKFVTPLTFQSVSGRPAYVDMFDTASGASELHIELARRANALLIAPASATTIARVALGLAEDLVSLTALATRAPIIVCPAMDPQMFEHEATQAHLETLRRRGLHVVGPEEGRLASGHTGPGRMSEVHTIIGALRYVLGKDADLAGRKVVVSAGGTQEPVDPVRYVGNYSSGKMGYALAEAARDRGADTVLVSAPAALPEPYAVRVLPVRQAAEMRDAVLAECADADSCTLDVCTPRNRGALILDSDYDHVTMVRPGYTDVGQEPGFFPGLNASTFTVECWFQWAGTGIIADTAGYLFEPDPGGIQAYPLVTKGIRGAEYVPNNPSFDGLYSVNYFLGILEPGHTLAADLEEHPDGPFPALNHPVYGTTVIDIGVWHHAAMTYDGSCWQLYLDGQPETDGTNCPNVPPADGTLHFFSVGAGQGWEG
ncbi:MAG: bifunctional phosphopantothenoylcysteine decarboxylase/phosphopantothenate--cysteine ligase CoaBC, partial [Chloroflexi bacterium]|nr:bifunctional phosphopantothenoylcysteine decarboxylase/phosphopantothenate--cysteine ligase CoaBC [Chloroflexota bacterium]